MAERIGGYGPERGAIVSEEWRVTETIQYGWDLSARLVKRATSLAFEPEAEP